MSVEASVERRAGAVERAFHGGIRGHLQLALGDTLPKPARGAVLLSHRCAGHLGGDGANAAAAVRALAVARSHERKAAIGVGDRQAERVRSGQQSGPAAGDAKG